jgi:hypothetical protein
MSSLTYSDFVKKILEGAKRRLSVPIKEKDPIWIKPIFVILKKT